MAKRCPEVEVWLWILPRFKVLPGYTVCLAQGEGHTAHLSVATTFSFLHEIYVNFSRQCLPGEDT